MGHSVNAITFRLGKSLLWRLLLVNPISLNFFFFNFSRSFLIYYRYINYLFKIKYFKIFYKKGFFFSHLTLRRGVDGKYFFKLYVLDTFFLRLKTKIKAFLLQFFVPSRLNRGKHKFKIRRSFFLKKGMRKRKGYPTYFFKKLLRLRSVKFGRTGKVGVNDFLYENKFKKYNRFMSGRTFRLFDFFNKNLNFFFFYIRNSGFLNLNNFFTKRITLLQRIKSRGFIAVKNSKILNSARLSKIKSRGKQFLSIRKFSRFRFNRVFPVKSRFFFRFVPKKPRSNFFSLKMKHALTIRKAKRVVIFRDAFLNLRYNLKRYTKNMYRFFGYNVFRVYKYKNIQGILRTVRRVRSLTRKFSNKYGEYGGRRNHYIRANRYVMIDKRKNNYIKSSRNKRKDFSLLPNSVPKMSGSRNLGSNFSRKKLTFFSKLFFFRIMYAISNFFGSVRLNSKNFVVIFKLVFVVFFRKFIAVYHKRLKKYRWSKGGRRLKGSSKLGFFFKRVPFKLFLNYYFFFVNYITKLFKLRKIYSYFKYLSNSTLRKSKFFFRFNRLVERLVFFLSITVVRGLMKKNIKKYVRCLYDQFTFKFTRFLQFKLVRLLGGKNLVNLKVQLVPLNCHDGITPDVYVNFLKLKIRRRFSFKSLIRPFIKGLKFMRSLRGVYGLGNGRFTRRQRASTVKITKGKISFSTVSAYLLYSFLPVVTRFGTCGVHIFFNFKKSKVKFKYKLNSIFKVS